MRGGPVELLETGNDAVFAFRRRQGASEVTVAVNLSNRPQSHAWPGAAAAQTLAAWAWRLDAR